MTKAKMIRMPKFVCPMCGSQSMKLIHMLDTDTYIVHHEFHCQDKHCDFHARDDEVNRIIAEDAKSNYPMMWFNRYIVK